MFNIPSYSFIHSLRKCKSGGGGCMGIYIHNIYTSTKRYDLSIFIERSFKCMFVESEDNNDKTTTTTIGVICTPPDINTHDNLLENFQRILHNTTSKNKAGYMMGGISMNLSSSNYYGSTFTILIELRVILNKHHAPFLSIYRHNVTVLALNTNTHTHTHTCTNIYIYIHGNINKNMHNIHIYSN